MLKHLMVEVEALEVAKSSGYNLDVGAADIYFEASWYKVVDRVCDDEFFNIDVEHIFLVL